MYEVMEHITKNPEIIDFMNEHPVHDATVNAFKEYFKQGNELRDLEFIKWTGMPDGKFPKEKDIFKDI